MIEVVETEDEVTVVVVEEAPEEVVRSLRRRNGSQSPNSVDSSKLAKSRAWNKSTCIPFRSKNIRLSTGFYPSSRTR